MLEVLVRIIGTAILTFSGYYVIKIILERKNHNLELNEILLIFLSSCLSILIYQDNYYGVNTIIAFLFNIVLYRFIFKISWEESIISTSILMIIIFLAEAILSIIYMPIISVRIARSNIIISLGSNLIVSLFCILILQVRSLQSQLNKFYNSIVSKKGISDIIFFTLIIIGFSYLLYNVSKAEFLHKEYILNFMAIIIFIAITYIFISNKNKYTELSNSYDNLFSYIQNFEDWIEKEQLNRHEYKNQLAVLRCMTKEKNIKDKIDEILEDNINIEEQEVTELKKLPKGGIKGLMYYKVAIAQKNKINLTTNVSIDINSKLENLSEKKIRIICKLIGIYFDNAIEAASESRKKNLSIEVYELSDKINFVFSNTFKNHKNLKDRNNKGVSSKGTGRGNGLYFANKLIKENNWLEQKQEIIDKYYIQQISIIKKSIF